MTAPSPEEIVSALRGARLDLALFATWRTPIPTWTPAGIVLEPTTNDGSDPAGAARGPRGTPWSAGPAPSS